MDGDKKQCLILADFPAEGMSVQDLAQILVGFAKQQVHWSQLVTLWPTSDQAQQQTLLNKTTQTDTNLMKV